MDVTQLGKLPPTPPKPKQLTLPEAEKQAAENANTTSIYGEQVDVNDATEWLKNNPALSQSPRLVKLVDYNANGAVEANELSRAATKKVVVLNGIKSFMIPGEAKSTTVGKVSASPPPNSAQEEYYRNRNAQIKAENTGKAVVGGLALLLGLGVLAKEGLDEVLR